ncbi:MAG: intradiol ring-cleavage dioxygenase [Acidimicrobiales bacterium]|nr:intradiol ring-cleavage dioxygenase [Acidimicrobiales bacterium]
MITRTMNAPELPRRAILLGMGALGANLLTGACSRRSSSPTVSDAASYAATSSNPTTDAECTLVPELTEGPFYLDVDLVRRNITEGRPGTPLRLTMTVLGADGCSPLHDVAVDVWHCDANGDYSPRGATFLRGTQITDKNGAVTFDTIYPGYYAGRAVHIHFKVHLDARTEVTSQLFFPDELNNEVLTKGVYASRGRPDMPNGNDRIFGQSAGKTLVQPVNDGDGYAATLTVTVANSKA